MYKNNQVFKKALAAQVYGLRCSFENRGRHVFIINYVESDFSVIWLSLLLHMQSETRQPRFAE